MKDRYIRNEKMLSQQENLSLRGFKVAVVGCGGLGGNIIEMMARLGIGHMTAIDGDVFEASNLNRQLLSLPSNLGQPKALAARERIREVNPDVEVIPVHDFLTSENAKELLAGHDLIIDALDNISSRRIVEKTAEELNTPLVFGAIAGWYAQVCTIFPGDKMMDQLYPEDLNKGEETLLGNPSFTPALAASLQVAEAVKVLLGKEKLLRKKLLVINLLDHEYDIIPFE
ncbi:MAG: HesA/MoeB/ThiF family protein [Bacteroidales bacterium]